MDFPKKRDMHNHNSNKIAKRAGVMLDAIIGSLWKTAPIGISIRAIKAFRPSISMTQRTELENASVPIGAGEEWRADKKWDSDRS